jgi:hypothetical protein
MLTRLLLSATLRKCIVSVLSASAITSVLLPEEALAQRNENCVVSVLNRNVQVRADGTWVLPNIPANFGQLRARATCVQGGVTTYGESAPFVIPSNGSVTLPPIVLGQTTPIPKTLTVSAPATRLSTVGERKKGTDLFSLCFQGKEI